MKQTISRVKVFVDTNVLVDYVLPERPRHEQAKVLFGLILKAQTEAGISTQSILDAAYIARKSPGFSRNSFRATVQEIMLRTNVESIHYYDLKDALKDSHDDLEDNAQIAFAYSQACDVLVTNDQQLLSREVPKPMKVMTPEAFVNCCRM